MLPISASEKLGPRNDHAELYGASADGNVIIGQMHSNGVLASYRWSKSDGPTLVFERGRWHGVNRDGSVLAAVRIFGAVRPPTATEYAW